MFEIYKFEFDNDFISQDELRSYIGMGLITQAEYHEIVDDKHEEANQATEGQANSPKLRNLDWAVHARKGIVVVS